MSKKLPIISVTEDVHLDAQSSDESQSNDMDYNMNLGGATDVEDLDSQADNPKPCSRAASNNGLKLTHNTQKDNDATDIEDYNDTDSDDDEKSKVYPELKLSLQEFLQNVLQEQSIVENEAKVKVENKTGNFLEAQELNGAYDYATDCEDYNTDSEIGDDCEKSVCVDLNEAVDNQGRVCIADSARSATEGEDSEECEGVSVLSDISDVISALSDATAEGMRAVSEDEQLEISGDEEECQIVYSGSSSGNEDNYMCDGTSNVSLSPIDVKFVGTGVQRRKSTTLIAKKNICLTVPAPTEEVLTDIEKLDDSAADDSFDSEHEEQPIPRAVILAAEDDGANLTDIEDVFCEENCTNIPTEIAPIADEALPLPHREMIVLKEDQFGDTIANVMPMDNEYLFGIYDYLTDDVRTEDEDYSCADDLENTDAVAVDCLTTDTLIEREVTIANEVYKPQVSKRLELHANTESVTDVEEIYVDGTHRRKKLKTRSMSKGKLHSKLLDAVKGKEEGGTDTEDMDLSERGLPSNIKMNAAEKMAQRTPVEKVTDIEYMTADEISDVSETDVAPDFGARNLNEYYVSSANIVVTLETEHPKHAANRCEKQISTLQNFVGHQTINASNTENTDVEDMQMPSDVESEPHDTGVRSLPQCTCNDLNDMLNESYTVVHEKSGNSFDVEAEKLHIKGMSEVRDAHTDIEYVESDESAARGGN